ncbi:MAG: ribbon-helix-helix protein, CopG family [Acetobacteraceae bacterium]|nr:ribbon-helix-helix protein, CopG family [Acetobacteraceae bacterium]
MIKDRQTQVRLDQETREALERAAQELDRTMSWCMQAAIREWLVSKGYLPKPSKAGRKDG